MKASICPKKLEISCQNFTGIPKDFPDFPGGVKEEQLRAEVALQGCAQAEPLRGSSLARIFAAASLSAPVNSAIWY